MLRVRTGVLLMLLCAASGPARAAVEAPLADAVMRQDRAAVRTLLAAGADVDAPRGDGMTALHWAARHGDVRVAGLLLAAGADPEAVTRLGRHTPLHVASRAGHGPLVAVLLEHRANAEALTSTGAAPLHFAAQSGSADAVETLLAHGADPDAREPRWGQTPLMFAAGAGRTAAVAPLLRWGADPALTATVVDISARSTLDQADSRRRRGRMARRLVNPTTRNPPDRADRLRWRARVAARAARSADRARQRVESRRPGPARPRPAAPSRSRAPVSPRPVTPTADADRQEEPEPLGYADLVGTHGGLTALLLAARDGHAETALALIAGGADVNRVSAADGTSPLLIACINGHFDLALLLLEAGADPTLASAAGATPLYGTLNMHWAPKARHPQPTDHLQQTASYLDVMRAVLDAGADVDARIEKSLWYTTYNRDLLGVDRAGATTFWRAAYALDIEAMRLLIEYGANPHLPTVTVPSRGRFPRPDPSGLPPVPLGGPAVSPLLAAAGVGYGQGYAGNSHRHVPGGWLPAVRFLVEDIGLDVRFRDHNGYNAVHHAAARGDDTLIRYLVDRGVDVTEVSRRGQTTVDMANGPVQRIQPFPETIALLESLGAKNNHRCLSC